MNKELKDFKYLFYDSRLQFINEEGIFNKSPTPAQAKDWHRKMVTIFSGDEEEIDMMDEILLDPKHANPYISAMFIKVLINKIISDFGNTNTEFRQRAYKSMIDNAKVCGEIGKISMASSLAKCFNVNQDNYNNACYNPFVCEDDAIKTKKEVLDTIVIGAYLRKKYKDEIKEYFMTKKIARLYLENKEVLNKNNVCEELEK